MINSKKIILSFVATIALASTSLAASPKVYAVVNGENITQEDVAMVLRGQRVNFENLSQEQQKQMISGLVEQKLLTNEAYKSDIIKQKEYVEELEKFKKTLAFQFWIRDFSKSITISDKEVQKFYNDNKAQLKSPVQLKASHILVKTKKEAEAIIADLLKSSDLKKSFTKSAQEKSVGPSGSNGGELGWFTADKMVPEFSSAALTLTVGTMTKAPVQSEHGFHVIYLDDKKKPVTLEFAQIKDRLKQDLLQKKFTDAVKKKAAALKKHAKIEYK